MKRSVTGELKLPEAETNSNGAHAKVKQEDPVDSSWEVETPHSAEDAEATINTEIPDFKVENITIKEEAIDCQQHEEVFEHHSLLAEGEEKKERPEQSGGVSEDITTQWQSTASELDWCAAYGTAMGGTEEKKQSRLVEYSSSDDDDDDDEVWDSTASATSGETTDSDDGSTKRPSQARKLRRRFQCPYCTKKLLDLPRHLRSVHNYSSNQAKFAVLNYNLKKHYKMKGNRKTRDYHKEKTCPVDGCSAVIKNLTRHLGTCHKMTLQEQVIENGVCSNEGYFDEDTRPSHRYESLRQHRPPKLLRSFSDFLASPMCDELNKGLIFQHSRRIKKMMSCVESDWNDYHKLLDVTQVNKIFRDLKSMGADGRKGLSHETLRGYISSLKHLVRFFRVYPNFDKEISMTKLETLNQHLTRLSRGMKKHCTEKNWHLIMRDQKKLPSEDDLKKYLDSKLRKKVKDVLGDVSAENSIVLTKKFLMQINAFFVIEISLGNANRADEVHHMLLTEYTSASQGMDGSKTVNIVGHAPLYLSPEFSTYMDAYVKFLRPVIATPSSPRNLFLTASGAQLSTSSLRFHMQAFWNNEGMKSQIDPPLIGKKAVSQLHISHPDEKAVLAAKVYRLESTASRSYLPKNCQDVTRELRNISVQQASKPSTSKDSSTSSAVYHQPTENPPSPANLMKPEPEECTQSLKIELSPQKHQKQEPTAVASIETPVEKSAELSNSRGFVLNHFSKDEEKYLSLAAQGFFAKGKVMKKEKVIRLLRSSKEGRRILEKFDFVKIKNKLNYLKYRKCRKF